MKSRSQSSPFHRFVFLIPDGSPSENVLREGYNLTSGFAIVEVSFSLDLNWVVERGLVYSYFPFDWTVTRFVLFFFHPFTSKTLRHRWVSYIPHLPGLCVRIYAKFFTGTELWTVLWGFHYEGLWTVFVCVMESLLSCKWDFYRTFFRHPPVIGQFLLVGAFLYSVVPTFC